MAWGGDHTRRRLALSAFLLSLAAAIPGAAAAGVVDDLELLRDRCLYFSVGRAPFDPGVVTIRNGLWAQSPWSPPGEIDLAASGFSLAALPAAVSNNLIGLEEARDIASNAAHRVRQMVGKSAAAATPADIAAYGYGGMLFHYAVWNVVDEEFRGKPDAEVSSIDTVLLLYGLMISARYFGGSVMADYEAARDLVDWPAWLDASTPGHENQFRMAYRPGTGFEGWWDWYSHETMLIVLWAGMSDPSLDLRAAWRAWTRSVVTYTSPGPDPQSFTCHATWNGDPFTVYYGLLFLDFASFPPSGDLDGVDWFREGRTAYRGHVEFFRRERGYLDGLTYSFFSLTGGGVIAHPRGSPDAPGFQFVSPVHAVAGGLPYYAADLESNDMARALSSLVRDTPGFFDWHGWPVSTVVATNRPHTVHTNWVVGQDLCAIALSIDNHLAGTARHLALKDPRLVTTLNRIWPPAAVVLERTAGPAGLIRWRTVPYGVFSLYATADLRGDWMNDGGPFSSSGGGALDTPVSLTNAFRCFRLDTPP